MFNRRRHNFLHAQSLHQPKSRRVARGAMIAVTVVAVIAAVIALVVVPFWLAGERAYVSMERGRDSMQLAQERAAQLQFGPALDAANESEAHFGDAVNDLRILLPLQGLPYVGPNLVAADRLAVTGRATADAVADLLTVARDVTAVTAQNDALAGLLTGAMPDLSALFRDLTPAQKRQMLAAFADNVPRMRDALAKSDEALAALDEVPNDIAPEFRAPIAPLRAELVTLRGRIASILPLAETIPAVLGYPAEKNYLFFFQNDTELRPTGGFLGVYGVATIRDADLVSLATDDIYALDGPAEATERPVPPAPIQKYIGITKWYLRDANWSPDFTISSALMTQFFNQEYPVAKGTPPPKIDGVLAIDTHFAVDVMKLVGPVTVEGKTFTPENLVDELEFAVEVGFADEGIATSQRKDIIGKLGEAVLDRLEAMPVAGLLSAVSLVQENLNEGHILLSSSDARLQQMVLGRDWGGGLAPVNGDYLLWVDANLAALKTDPSVQRSITYSIAPEPGRDGSYIATAKMTYRHTGRFDWKTTRLRTYSRVYVPAGSQLLEVRGAMENDRLKDPARRPGRADVGNEIGRAWFGAFISVEPGETRTLEFRYRLAPSVVDKIDKYAYRLEVEKQPGTAAHGLTVDVDLGKNIKTAMPAEAQSEWGNTRYTITTDLRTDREFEVGL